MTSLENPNPRETFDKNEDGIAQTKKAIAEAVAAGDYDKVGTLAQEAKGMEASNLEMSTVSQEAVDDNKAFDEAKAAEEKAKRDTELAEQAKLQAAKDSQEAAALLAKLQGSPAEAPSTETTEASVIGNAEPVATENTVERTTTNPEEQEVVQKALETIQEKLGNYKDSYGTILFKVGDNEIEVRSNDKGPGWEPFRVQIPADFGRLFKKDAPIGSSYSPALGTLRSVLDRSYKPSWDGGR